MDGVTDIVSILFWMLLFYALINPHLQMRALRSARLDVIKRIERKYGWRLITLIHRQESISFFGVPVYRYIDIDDSEAVIRAIRSTPPDKRFPDHGIPRYSYILSIPWSGLALGTGSPASPALHGAPSSPTPRTFHLSCASSPRGPHSTADHRAQRLKPKQHHHSVN